MSLRTVVFALAVLAFPLAAWAQSPPAEPAVPHPPGVHQPAPAPPHPAGAHEPAEPAVPHPPGAHEPAPPPPHPAGAHEPAPPKEPSAPHPPGVHEDKSAPEMPKAYVPGLEAFMTLIQREHAKLWYAGRARNWPLAAYALAEIKEVMSDVQDFVPTFRNLPLADMLDAVITGEIAQLEKAVDAKDRRAFAAGYDKLTAACNACHRATGNGFIRIRRPRGRAFPNQDFRPHKQR